MGTWHGKTLSGWYLDRAKRIADMYCQGTDIAEIACTMYLSEATIQHIIHAAKQEGIIQKFYKIPVDKRTKTV